MLAVKLRQLQVFRESHSKICSEHVCHEQLNLEYTTFKFKKSLKNILHRVL
jgi:hypothetical protein